MPNVNLLAIVLASVAAMVIGTVWYMPSSPFGKRWQDLIKRPPEMRSPGSAMALQVFFTVVSMFVLAVLILTSGVRGAMGGATIGLLVWLLVALSTAGDANFSGRPWALWMLNSANWLITLIVAGAIIGFVG